MSNPVKNYKRKIQISLPKLSLNLGSIMFIKLVVILMQSLLVLRKEVLLHGQLPLFYTKIPRADPLSRNN